MDLNPFGIRKPERRQARHICRIQNQTRFQAPAGAEYAAPTGLENLEARVATKISLRTELAIPSRLERFVRDDVPGMDGGLPSNR